LDYYTAGLLNFHIFLPNPCWYAFGRKMGCTFLNDASVPQRAVLHTYLGKASDFG
jgi:hypothetical protein